MLCVRCVACVRCWRALVIVGCLSSSESGEPNNELDENESGLDESGLDENGLDVSERERT